MKNILQNFMLAALTLAISGGLSLAAAQPRSAPTPKPRERIEPALPVPPSYEYKYKRGTRGTYERSIAVAPNLNFKLCVTEGNLKVNGWNRNEVRVYVEGGSKFMFKVIDKGPDGRPVWIAPVNMEGRPGMNVSECIRGETVEIDVPKSTSLTLSGKAIDAQIDTLKKVSAKTVGGDILIRNVREGVSALTYEGDITVEESWGAVSLESTTGNIVVVDSGPSDIGDSFKAKTNSGAVSLTRVTHRQQEISSISGSVFFSGDLKSGGTYGFNTTNGTIRIALPAKTGFRLAATFTAGSFESELPFTVETENVAPGDMKSIVAKVGGGGDAILKLTTAQGLIGIRKQ